MFYNLFLEFVKLFVLYLNDGFVMLSVFYIELTLKYLNFHKIETRLAVEPRSCFIGIKFL